MMATGHGGRRPNAGRKPRTEKYQAAINRAEKQIADKLPDLLDSLFDLAQGVKVREFNVATMEQQVYDRPPDFKAASYLVDRVMGKPAQTLSADLTSNGETLPVVGYLITPPGRSGEPDAEAAD